MCKLNHLYQSSLVCHRVLVKVDLRSLLNLLPYLCNHLQDLVLCLRRSQNSQALQTTKAQQNLPLLLQQTQVAVGGQRPIPPHLLRGGSVLLGATLHQPIMMHFLFEELTL